MISKTQIRPHWSSQVAVYLGTIGAAVGLGSIWRFPYLAGTLGGGTFISVFVLACLFIATPLLIAEYLIGRYAGVAPSEAAGAVAVALGLSRRWNAIGQLGTLAAFLICSYYTIVAGWVVAYAWKCVTGGLVGLSRSALHTEWQGLLADPRQLVGWQLLFLTVVAWISARGLGRGIELASRIRAPALLALLLILDAYALVTGDVRQTFRFVLAPHWDRLSVGAPGAVGERFDFDRFAAGHAAGVSAGISLPYGPGRGTRAGV